MRKVLFAIGIAALVSVACKGAPSYTGKWKMKPGLAAVLKDDQKQVAGMFEGSTIEITKEKAFIWTIPYGGMQVPISGTWSESGDKLNVKLDTIQGQPLSTVSAAMPAGPQKKNFDNLLQPMIISPGENGEIKMQSTIPNAPTFVLLKAE